MRPESLKQLIDFVALGIILGLSLFGLYFFRFQIKEQLIVTVILGLSYIFWEVL